MSQIRLPGRVYEGTIRATTSSVQSRVVQGRRGSTRVVYTVGGKDYDDRSAAEAAAGQHIRDPRRNEAPVGTRGNPTGDYVDTRPTDRPANTRGNPTGTSNTGSTSTSTSTGGRRQAQLQVGIPRDQRQGERGPVGRWRDDAGGSSGGGAQTSSVAPPTLPRRQAVRQDIGQRQSQARQPLPGLRDRATVDAATSGAANAISQAAAAARSTGGVGPGSGNFGTNVGGRGVTASIEGREAISTGVGPQFQLDQLQVNQDLQGRAAAQSTAAHGIRADLPGRVAAQRLTEGRGRTRGRASTILTSGGARGLGSTPANTLGARRLVSGRTPATPVEGTQAGEAAAAQAGVQQRQGILAEQDRAGLAAQVQADGFDPQALRNTPQTSDTRSAGARRTSRREALIGGTSVGGISGGPGGVGGTSGGSGAGFGLAQDGGDPRSLGAARRPRPGSRDQTARATGQAAASRSRQGGRPPQRGNVPERVRARRTLLGGG